MNVFAAFSVQLSILILHLIYRIEYSTLTFTITMYRPYGQTHVQYNFSFRKLTDNDKYYYNGTSTIECFYDFQSRSIEYRLESMRLAQ